ncbi:MAG TPA: prolyl oligopeptidase family serine peptidase [Rhizomicrobium sp.]|nr:prolyl oligopeptidase family serine peptidase [Rhizomicrobium sp.]
MKAKLALLACAGFAIANTACAASGVAIHTFDKLALSPSGDRVAAVEATDAGNLTQEAHGTVVVRSADGKVVATYDPCPACKYSDTAWSAKGDLAFISTDDAAGKATVFVVANGKPRAAASVGGVANTLRWSPDGMAIAALVTLGAHKKTGATEASAALVGEIGVSSDEQRIATVAASGGALKPVSPADTYIYEYSWTPDGKGFAATGAKGNGDNNWWIATLDYVNAQSGALRVVAAPKMQLNLPRVSPDGKTVAFIGGLMSDWGSIGGDIYTVPLAGGTPTDVTPKFAGTFDGVAWAGNTLVASALIGDRAAAVAVDPAAKTERTLWSAPVSTKAQRFDGSIVFSADGAIAATVTEDFTHAQEIAIGKLPLLAPVTNANAVLAANVSAQSIHWKNEGYNVQGWLIGPKQVAAGRKYPMVTIVHGGPSAASGPRYIAAGGQYGTNFDFTYDLISRGYYIFYPNDRGSYGQGEAFTRANIKDFGRGDLRDMLAGIDAVEKIAPVDDARLGLYGHSYGGWMAMWANTQTRRFKAIVAGAGIADWTSYYGQNGIDQWMIPFFGASVYDDPAVYRAAAPIEFIKQAKTPTLLYVGERDVECPAPQSLEYWHALKALGTPVRLYIYAGEGHHFHKPGDLEDLRARIIGWFGTYLK